MTTVCGIFASLKLCTEENKAFEKYLKGQITNYKPAVQITSISRKSDSKPLLGQF